MIKGKQLRKVTTGLLLAVLVLTMSVSVFGDSVKENIEVLYNNIKLVVDGQPITFAPDSSGNAIEPFIYNGTTYLPARAVAEALDKSVDWDGKTSTVYIGKKPGDNSPDKYLSELEYFNQQSRTSESIIAINKEVDKDSAGNYYQDGLMIKADTWKSSSRRDSWIYNEYLLNQEYKTLSGKFVLHYDTRTSIENATLKVYGDDELLYTSPIMTAGELAIDVNVDVEGVIKLKVMVDVKTIDGWDNPYYIFGDAGLFK